MGNGCLQTISGYIRATHNKRAKQSIPQEPSDLQQQGLPQRVPVFKAGVSRWGAAFGAPEKMYHIVPMTCLLLTLYLKSFLACHSVSLSTCMAMLASGAAACPGCGLLHLSQSDPGLVSRWLRRNDCRLRVHHISRCWQCCCVSHVPACALQSQSTPTTKVRLRHGDVLIVDTLPATIQLNAFRNLLADGFQAHLQHNALLHQIFNFQPREEPAERLTPEEKRLFRSPASAQSKSRTQQRKSDRAASAAYKGAMMA